MTMLNELDPIHWVMAINDRLQQSREKSIFLKQKLTTRKMVYKISLDKNG
jgi:hypothetical protein